MQAPTSAAATSRPAVRRAGAVVSWLLLAAVTIVVLGLAAITIGPRFLPYQALVVRSGSMSPTIPTGSIVFYTKIDAAKVKSSTSPPNSMIVLRRPSLC